MAERGTVFNKIQVGKEVTAGTGVAADKRLASMSIQPGIKFEGQPFVALGNKFMGVYAPNKEWVEAKVTGAPTYDEIVYALCSAVKSVTPTGAGTAKTWTFSPALDSADVLQTFTVEHGDSVRADKFTHGQFKDLGFNITRSGITMSGAMIGQRITDAITLTASPTSIALVPVLPTQVTVKYADSQAGLAGASALGRSYTFDWSLTNRITPIWTLNSANTSWVTSVEVMPTVKAKLKMQADAEGMALLTQLRSGDTKFFEVKATGSIIESSTPYTFSLQMSSKVTNVTEFTDHEGTVAIEWELDAVYNSTWTKTLEFVVINTLTAL